MATATNPAKRRAKPSKVDTYLLVFLLDRSSSMTLCHQSTLLGFNRFLHDQQDEKHGQASMTLVQFDSSTGPICEARYSAVDIREVADLGTPQNQYAPRGGTPLFDAVAETILATEKVADRYDHVLFVIQTDGEENSSREWTQSRLFDLVGGKRAVGWDFVFMGADIDAYSVGTTFNVPLRSTFSYESSSQSGAAFANVSQTMSTYRTSGGTVLNVNELAGSPVQRPKHQ